MKERHQALGEFARRARILHARRGGGKVMVLGWSEPAPANEDAAGLPVHEPVPPSTTGIVRAKT